MFSDDLDRQFNATTKFRKLPSKEKNPSIERVIECSVVPRFVEILRSGQSMLQVLNFWASAYIMPQFESAWAPTHISSGNAGHTQAIPEFIKLLPSPVWTLANKLGFRKHRWKGALRPLLTMLSENHKLTMLRNTRQNPLSRIGNCSVANRLLTTAASSQSPALSQTSSTRTPLHRSLKSTASLSLSRKLCFWDSQLSRRRHQHQEGFQTPLTLVCILTLLSVSLIHVAVLPQVPALLLEKVLVFSKVPAPLPNAVPVRLMIPQSPLLPHRPRPRLLLPQSVCPPTILQLGVLDLFWLT